MDLDKTEAYEAGAEIFREGEPGERMYVLVSGAVELRKRVAGAETVLKTVDQAHDFFGEMSLVDASPRSATALAVKPTRLLSVDADAFESLVLSNAKFALKIIQALSERIRNANRQISELSGTRTADRIARGMVDYALRHGERIHDASLKVAVTEMRESLAARLGIAPQEFDAALPRFIKGESIRWAPTSAQTKEHILLPPAFVREHDRRERGMPV